ncbi:MAG: hypothetical protein K1Y01_08985 [Vicinamibacteria bacterium]|nr:hypothetical protein [Vicinamibacteria bacterium]
MALPLACGLTLRFTGELELAQWARGGATVWFLKGPAEGASGSTWEISFERGRPLGPFANPPRWGLRLQAEECRTPWGGVTLQPAARRCLIRMPDHHGMGYLIHLALGAMLRHQGRVQLHAAALAPEEGVSAVLVAGPSGSGKTTLTLNLARRGWGFLSDDSVALSQEGGGFSAAPVRLRFMQGLHGEARKRPLDPDAEFPGRRLWSAPVGALVFIEPARSSSCSLSPLTPTQALSRLPALIPGFGPDTGRCQIRMLARLASLPSFLLHSGADVPQGGGSAAALLRDCLNRAGTPLDATMEARPRMGA